MDASKLAAVEKARRLLVAVDLDPGSAHLLEQAASWAERLGARVDIVHALDEDGLAPWIGAAQEERIAAHIEMALANLAAGLPEAVRGDTHLVVGRPRKALVKASEGYQALVLGTRREDPHAVWHLGSVAAQVTRAASVPTLVFRADPEPA